MAPGTAVLSIEFKINLLSPGAGERFVASGRVIRAGKTITTTWGEVTAIAADGGEKVVATMVATMMTVQNRGLTD